MCAVVSNGMNHKTKLIRENGGFRSEFQNHMLNWVLGIVEVKRVLLLFTTVNFTLFMILCCEMILAHGH